MNAANVGNTVLSTIETKRIERDWCVIENRPQQLNGLNDSIKNRHFMLDADGLFSRLVKSRPLFEHELVSSFFK